MPSLSVFNFISLNGNYKRMDGDISWHLHGGEENAYSEKSLESGNTLLFGRITYEMMASFWPTEMAYANSPIVAAGMNKAEKIVFSKTLNNADWNNTIIMKNNIVEEIKSRKEKPGNDMTILGSGSIVTKFTEAGLIDTYHFMIDPVIIKNGTPVFDCIKSDVQLVLTETKNFKSGVVLLSYAIVRE